MTQAFLARRIGFVLLAVLTLIGGGAASAQDRSLEFAVKATYLYKFAPFVGWPSDVFISTASPFDICVLGDSGFARLVADGVAGQTIDARPFAVRSLSSVDDAAQCQIVFVGGADRAAALAALRGKPVLTVTDAGDGGGHGVINFVLVNDRVRFEIDLAEAADHHLTISSKLLSLAVSVQSASSPRQP